MARSATLKIIDLSVSLNKKFSSVYIIICYFLSVSILAAVRSEKSVLVFQF